MRTRAADLRGALHTVAGARDAAERLRAAERHRGVMTTALVDVTPED